MRKVHLICNAHLDPVWLWQRNEGMAEAIATFRIAADFCEKYDDFVFNHNESVLYEWVQENEPELFERIIKLVKLGKWRIMSGWYLQPDVLMPCGESIIRQIKVGNNFFKNYFGEIPKTSIGFDAFGHSRGLVQILKKCGYDNYAYLRPRDKECGPFLWKGFDGSCINTYKLYEWYNTPKGEALERLVAYDKDFPNRQSNVVTWGIGNHGGGPSEKDFNDINNYIKESKDTQYLHSDFDSYFNGLDTKGLETVESSITHCMVGCYTSMVQVKQGHRRLENRLSMCERMLCQSGVSYDKSEFEKAEKALLFSEFHDVLPGSAIKKVENDSLRLINYGDEILDRLISKSFFVLCKGQKKANEGEIPVMVYNPHPYEIEGDFEVEFQMAEQNHPDNGIFNIKLRNENGEYVSSQIEHEDSAHGMDWRKKVVFHTKLNPMSVNRFDCELNLEEDFVKIKPFDENETHILLENDNIQASIDKSTGMIDKYVVNGVNMVKSVSINAYYDNADPWGMEVDSFLDFKGKFSLYQPVRVIENGDVRTKIQSVLSYDKSFAFVTYTFSKNAKYIDIDVKMLANDENTMYKLSVETTLGKDAKALCQTMFGTEITHKEGKESVFQKWCGLVDDSHNVSVINMGTYGGCFEDNIINISLLRTPVYSAHPVDGVELAPNDRIYNHIDMGERNFSFRLCADEEHIDYQADLFNMNAYTLSFFPNGEGEKKNSRILINNNNVLLSTYRIFEEDKMIRLYNSKNNNQKAEIVIDDNSFEIEFTPFEVKTFVLKNKELVETDMLGNLQ